MTHPITILGLGPGPAGLMTLGAAEALRRAKAIVLRTDRHGAADFLKEQGIPFDTLDALYDSSEDFDGFARAAVCLLEERLQGPCYGVADPTLTPRWTCCARRPALFGGRRRGVSAAPLLAARRPAGPTISEAVGLKAQRPAPA